MSTMFATFLRPVLFGIDAEKAHAMAIGALKTGLMPASSYRRDPRLRVNIAGLSVPNPLGMAAGFDKNAEVPDALLRLGFGFVEVGTVTPRPQSGNPKPRVFRLVEDNAVVNRLGFNNEGHAAAFQRLRARQETGIVGVNLGANKDSADRADDYVCGINAFYDVADYFTVNISSPNTPGLRDLQARASLADLLARVMTARDRLADKGERAVPVFLKIAPDLTEADLDDIAAELLANKLEGLIVSNTTLSRTGIASKNRSEAGGLSGVPLFERSTIVLAKMRQRLGRYAAIIGVGGINSGETALAKIEAGADLVQLYTGFIYEGPGLPMSVVDSLANALDRSGKTSISQHVGMHTAEWAAKPIPV
jgi:dihydroorotate dehydrogenase